MKKSTTPAARIASRRAALGMSPSAASREAGISQAYWHQLEHGVRNKPSWEVMLSVCRVLQCTIFDIWEP